MGRDLSSRFFLECGVEGGRFVSRKRQDRCYSINPMSLKIIGETRWNFLKLLLTGVLLFSAVPASASNQICIGVYQAQNEGRPNGMFGNRIWSSFERDHDMEFIEVLKQFSGNNQLAGKKHLRGGEGQLFESPLYPRLALKRFFVSKGKDPWIGVEILKLARNLQEENLAVNEYIEIAKIYETGSDWILRDFNPNTIPLKIGITNPDVSSAFGNALAVLKKSSDPIAKKIIRLLEKSPPSDNVHWIPETKKFYIFDMTKIEFPSPIYKLPEPVSDPSSQKA